MVIYNPALIMKSKKLVEHKKTAPVRKSKLLILSPQLLGKAKKKKLDNNKFKENILNASDCKPDSLELTEEKKTTSISAARKRVLAAKFRMLNEKLYTQNSKSTFKLFKESPELYNEYHRGFRSQVDQWPENPVDHVIKNLKSRPASLVVADLGCGDGKLGSSVPQKVHSFDLISTQPHVRVCDMSNVLLPTASVDIVVFCLSLMGTNIKDFICEANRILKENGEIKIAEVTSRFEKVETFISQMESFGFKLKSKNFSSKIFTYLDFVKLTVPKSKRSKLPDISLKPCLYKKR